MNDQSSKPDAKSLTGFLKALLAGGAVLLGAGTAQASMSSKPLAPKPEGNSTESLENRLERVRKQLAQAEEPAQNTPDSPENNAPLDEAKKLWWRNWGNWRNGGWPNWRNGWHNWGNGGWGNGRHRGGIWANF